ncbi:pseudouridine synthase [Alteromonas sp. 5E99-2]|uniref:pseudouridine synthase n=1 Tax=Alteromonas sp. 5E99-2 TaxID=2817683 RepID=UPI001F61C754|nr:pseudouridine synthase [Alteromonas sp. 5E99-2]
MEIESKQPADILYQDEWLVAINKPSGQLVHRSPLDPHATDFAVQHVRDTLGTYVYPIHRLDRPTSGVLLFALYPGIVTQMQSVWEHRVHKQYKALVRGWLHGNGYIDYSLKYQADKLAEANKKENIVQTAMSSYVVRNQYEAPLATKRYATTRYSLIDLSLHTGRKHQLRRHLAHIRHPIIGDTSHGDGAQNKIARQHLGCKNLLLTCTKLAFEHPKTGANIMITSPLSPNFSDCLSRLDDNCYLQME